MFKLLDNTFDWFGYMWAEHKDEIDWSVQIAMLAYAVIFGIIMTLIVAWLS